MPCSFHKFCSSVRLMFTINLIHGAMNNVFHVYVNCCNALELALKGALYRIWCGVNRLGDSGVKVV